MPDRKDVPSIDLPEIGEDTILNDRVSQVEDKLTEIIEGDQLGKGDELRNSELSDKSQHRWLQWIAVGVSVIVILGFSCLLYHLTHKIFLGTQSELPDSVLVAMFVTPIVSITTITIFLLIGVFRKFKDKGIDNIPVSNLVREVGRQLGP